MPPEVRKDVKEISDIAGLAGLVRDVSVQIEKGEERFTVLEKDLQDNKKTIETWCKEMEEKVSKAMKGGVGPLALQDGEALKAVIPQRHQKALEMYSRTTMKRERAIRMTAMESWLKNAIMLHNPQFAARLGGKFLEEMDAVEKAFGFEPVAKSAMQEDTNTEGGYLVPSFLEAEVLRLIEDNSIMRGLCRVVPMMGPTHDWPTLDTNVVINITPEEGTITSQEPTFGQKQLRAKTFTCRAIASMQLVQDAAIGIFSFLFELINEKYGLKEDQQILEGTGVGSEFIGLNAAPGVNEVTNGANGALIDPAQVLEQKWKARKKASRSGAAWVMAPEIARNIEKFRVAGSAAGDGGFLYGTMFSGDALRGMLGLAEGVIPDGVLHGFPLYTHSEILVNRVVGSSGAVCSNVYFGPWRNAVIIGDRLGIQFGVSEHTQWATGQLDLRMIKRTAGLVGVPSAMTKQTGIKTA